MHYTRFGKISQDMIDPIKDLVSNRSLSAYRDRDLDVMMLPKHITHGLYSAIFPKDFETDEVQICHSKVLITMPEGGWWIHKDGKDKNVAFNIVLQCNPEDWVRWYSEEEIEKLGLPVFRSNSSQSSSRDVLYKNYENTPFELEIHNEPGDVYLVNTDKYHTFKNKGTQVRLVIQTKFKPNPTFEQVLTRINQTGLLNIS